MLIPMTHGEGLFPNFARVYSLQNEKLYRDIIADRLVAKK